MRTWTIKVFPVRLDRSGWRWALAAPNGTVLCESKLTQSKSNTTRAARRLEQLLLFGTVGLEIDAVKIQIQD